MKRSLLSALVLSILFISISVPSAYATEIITENNVIIAQGEIIDDDLIVIGENIRIFGKVKGDVIAIGIDIIIDDGIDGDITALGEKISIKGDIGDDLFVAGSDIDIDGPDLDNAMVFGSDIKIGKDTNIRRDLLIIGTIINIEGMINKDARLYGNDITISGDIGGNVTVESESLTILPSTAISGDLNYTGPEEADINDISSIKGDIIYNQKIKPQKSYLDSIKISIEFMLPLLLIGFLIIYFMPGFIERTDKIIRTRTLTSIISGITGLIIIPIVSILMIITIIGIPISLMILALYIMGLYISKIFIGITLGQYILKISGRKKQTKYLCLIVGLVALELLFMIPFISCLAKLIALVLGFGALIIARYEILIKNKKKR